MKTLTEDEVKSRLDPARLLAAIEKAFRSRYPHALIPLRTQMRLGESVFLMMPCYDRQNRSLGMKLITVLDNPPTPEQKIQATYLVLDPLTGEPLASMSAAYLTICALRPLLRSRPSISPGKMCVCSVFLALAGKRAHIFVFCDSSGISKASSCQG